MKRQIKNFFLNCGMPTTVHSVHVSCVDVYHQRLDQSIKLILSKILKPKTRQHVYVKQSDLL